MEEDVNEDNECPWCGKDCFYEFISFDPKTLQGKYECNCPDCGKDCECKISKVEE